MEKKDIQNNKNFFIQKMDSKYHNRHKKKTKKLFRQKSDLSRFNNTSSTLKYQINSYLNNSNNKYNINDNTITDIRIDKIISPIKKLRNSNSSKSKNKNNSNNKNRPQSSAKRKLPILIDHNLINNKIKTNNNLNIDTEKLNYEKYQLNKIIKNLQKELFLIKIENQEKEEILNNKEEEINNIIINTNNSLDDEYNLTQNYNYNSIQTENRNIYFDGNTLQNNSSHNLYLKIKKEIKNFNKKIKEEEEKINKLKHSKLYTKLKEIKVEYNTLEEQINKISSLINNSLNIKENNYKKLNEIKSLEYNINIQNNLLNELNRKKINLYEEKEKLDKEIKNTEVKLTIKKDKVIKNKKLLNSLIKKNNNLTNEQVIKTQIFKKIDNNKNISFKSIFINKKTKIQKLIKFYKNKFKYNESIINNLKEQKKNLIENIKLDNKIKLDNLLLLKENNNNKQKKNKEKIVDDKNKKEDNFKSIKLNLSPDNKELEIEELKTEYKDIKIYEKIIEEKYKEFFEKFNQINEYNNQQNINNEFININENIQNQLEFGIDKNNPYYTEKEDNKPEIHNKFTCTQFNQFTYILFKNFESKGIVSDEIINKIINPFIKIEEDNKLYLVKYPSDKFDFIVEEYTKIILTSINCENNYNQILTKIFVGALLINSGCNVQKLIEYFNTLNSYTINYINKEEKYISKLRNKYQEQIKKLYLSINNYLEKEQKENKLEESPIYFPLIKIKELIEKNNINIKDKYIEFLYYYLKKFSDNKEKLDEIKYSLLNDILKNKDNNNINNENIIKDNINNNMNNSESYIKENISENISDVNNNNVKENDITNDIVENCSKENNNNKEIKTNSGKRKENYSKSDESMNEINDKEYMKQISETIKFIKNGITKKNISFDELIKNIKKNVQVENNNINCFSINDFDEKLKEINIFLSDLKLSCLCSKYSLPNNLTLIDIKRIEQDLYSK